jgi:membrane dipeptidase
VNAAQLHQTLTVFEGLGFGNWSRAVFEDMRAGGITAANCSCLVWEDFRAAMGIVVQWNRWFDQCGDVIRRVRTTGDIARAKAEGKVGIILGWQNTSGIDDQLGFLEVFKDLGVGFMQLTYNTQNLIGTGCYESRDSGLSDFGREAVHEMNRVGIAIDLSHVGPKTCEDTILHSRKPVCYTHVCPRALRDHPRNKTDSELRLIAERGGFVGITRFTPLLPRGIRSTLDDYVAAMEYAVDLVGEDAVGIGTDIPQDQPESMTWYAMHDKGYARQLADLSKETGDLPGLARFGEFPNITATMVRRGWSEARIRKVMGENWVRFLRQVWGA